MKSRLSGRIGFMTLVLALLLLSSGTAHGQMECIDNCLEQLAACTNRTGGSVECEDAYDACLEACLSL